jgi:hypothetical protein
MIPRLAISVLCVVAFGSCERKSEAAGVSPEVAALLRRVQQENGLDDDRLRMSLDQWVQFNEAVSEVAGSGGITAEELKEAVVSSKTAVKVVSEQISTSDLMNVALLDGLVSGKEAEMKEHLRQEVAKAYGKAGEQKSESVNAKLIEKVEALRKKDPALDEMIRREAAGEGGE